MEFCQPVYANFYWRVILIKRKGRMYVEQDRFIQMTQSPLKGLILRMAVPSMASMLVTAIYNMVDTYFVGFIGTSATGAVGVVFSLMAIIMATGLMQTFVPAIAITDAAEAARASILTVTSCG